MICQWNQEPTAHMWDCVFVSGQLPFEATRRKRPRTYGVGSRIAVEKRERFLHALATFPNTSLEFALFALLAQGSGPLQNVAAVAAQTLVARPHFLFHAVALRPIANPKPSYTEVHAESWKSTAVTTLQGKACARSPG